MTYRLITLLLLLSLPQIDVAAAKPHRDQTERLPNILWIVTDDHRPDSVRAYNRAVYGKDESPLGYVESPNIDRLASEGVLFTRAMCNSPACGPWRAWGFLRR